MGFWHTGYMEFHDQVGLDPPFVPPPIAFACRLCSATFEAEEDLHKHNFESHPRTIPRLFVRGMAIGNTEFVCSEALSARDVVAVSATEALINGRVIANGQLGRELSRFTNATVNVELSRDGIRETFKLRFDVARPEDIEAVEGVFLAMAEARTLDVRAIDDFIRNVTKYSTAQRYADGVCDYLYGVLAKEGSGGSTIGYDAHIHKFNSASHTLAGYRRPLASVIRALIALNFNQFREAADLGIGSRVGVVAGRFHSWLSGSEVHAQHEPAVVHRIDSYLTDRDSELIIRTVLQAERCSAGTLENLEDQVQRDTSELDRAKLRVLLAQVYLGQGRSKDALLHAKELQNIEAFRAWANRLKEQDRKEM